MTSVLGPLLLAAGFALSLAAIALWAASSRSPRVSVLARGVTWAVLVAALGAAATMEWALVTNDFSVRYVAENSAREVPLYYRVISLWAALEGSLLLWLLVLAGYAVTAAHLVHARARALHGWAMATIMSVATFFFGLALAGDGAFDALSPVPSNGPGPNPLLQDHPLMGAHPPLLYIGYVGLTVPFAYAIAALVTGRTGRDWLVVTRRWLLVAWTALTAGVVLGAWWSYEVLGWGGYWSWDPVENASILPWFTATALLHSVMVQERRSILRVWNLTLASATFLLVLIGTFITRSGVIASVHAFSQSVLGPMLLGYIGAVTLVVIGLMVWRADRLGAVDRIESTTSRESAILVNNVLFVTLAATVLIGTTFPLLVEALRGDRVSVGAPYFNRMVVPIALVVVLLMGIGPVLPWGGKDASTAGRRLRLPAVLGLGTIAGLGLAGLPGPTALATFGVAVFAITAIAGEVAYGVRRVRADRGGTWVGALGCAVGANRRRYGGLLAHAGVVLMAVSVAASSSYAGTTSRTLRVGESLQVAGYTATLASVNRERTDRFMRVRVEMDLAKGGRDLGSWAPEMRFYPAMTQAIGRPSVRTGLTSDAYLTISSVSADAATASVRLTVTPLMLWLWISGGVMVAGAVLAGWPARRRRGSQAPVTAPQIESMDRALNLSGSPQ